MSQSINWRMRQYLVFRLLITVLGVLLVTFYVTWLRPARQEATCVYFYSLLGFHLAIGVVALATFSRWKRRWHMFRLHVLTDFAIQAVLIWSTGGVVSIFSPILFLTLAATTGVFGTRGAFLLASLATLFLGVAAFMYALGVVPATASWSSWIFAGERAGFLVSYLLASVLALYTISTLGSKLSYGLRHAEHLQEEIIENMAEGLLAVDQDGKVLHLNSEARKLLGLPGAARDYRKWPLRELEVDCTYAGQNRESWRDLFQAFVSGKKRRFETTLMDQKGIVRPVEVKISSVLDEKGRCRCRIGLFVDLSLKREIEAAERRIQKLEELQVMAMGIAHEIRNPLASIRGCVQEISRRGAGDQTQCQFADIVMRESDRLDRIIEDFLRYARSAPFDLRPLDLVEVLEQAALLIKNRPELCDRALKWEAPADRFRVYGDRDHLLQVFLNLGINALQATPAQGGVLEIQVHRRAFATLRGRWGGGGEPEIPGVEIVFRDNGHGMKKDDISKAFTPFFTTKEQGTGLGLSIVERFVREHKGLVDIESSPGEGAAVKVRLPLLSSGEEGAEGDEGTEQQKCAAAKGSNVSVSTGGEDSRSPEVLCHV